MACHMVAVPAHINNDVVGPCSEGPHQAKDCRPGRRRSEAGWDWLSIAAGGAEASYDWLGESAAWAAMTAGCQATIQSPPADEQVLERIELISVDPLHLSCATTPTAVAPSSARAARSSIKAPWVRSLDCTPRDTTTGACAPRSLRAPTVGRLTSSSSAELLTTSPSLLLPPRPRGLAQLAQSSGQSDSEQPREPTTCPPPLALPPRMSSPPQSPKNLALELEQNVSVTNTKLENGVGLYEVTWLDKSDREHTVWRRYSDFSSLHMSLCEARSSRVRARRKSLQVSSLSIVCLPWKHPLFPPG